MSVGYELKSDFLMLVRRHMDILPLWELRNMFANSSTVMSGWIGDVYTQPFVTSSFSETHTLKQRCQATGVNWKQTCDDVSVTIPRLLRWRQKKRTKKQESRHMRLRYYSSDCRNLSRGSQTVPGNVSINPTPLDSCTPAGLPALQTKISSPHSRWGRCVSAVVWIQGQDLPRGYWTSEMPTLTQRTKTCGASVAGVHLPMSVWKQILRETYGTQKGKVRRNTCDVW